MKAFNLLFIALLIACPVAKAQERIGAMYYINGRDPMTDARLPMAIAPSEEQGLDAGLGWRCNPSKDVVITFPGQVIVGDYETDGSVRWKVLPVRWRFDDKPAQLAEWHVSWTSNVLIIPQRLRDRFTAEAKSARVLKVRLEPPRNEPTILTFDLTGATKAISRVRCFK